MGMAKSQATTRWRGGSGDESKQVDEKKKAGVVGWKSAHLPKLAGTALQPHCARKRCRVRVAPPPLYFLSLYRFIARSCLDSGCILNRGFYSDIIQLSGHVVFFDQTISSSGIMVRFCIVTSFLFSIMRDERRRAYLNVFGGTTSENVRRAGQRTVMRNGVINSS